jgi:AAA family ATP:ADP antiporter
LQRGLLAAPGEIRGFVFSFLYFFLLLCSYYILRPVRDEMGIQGGLENLQWLFTGTFLAMLCAVPAFGWLATRFPRQRLVPLVYYFFAANLLIFYGLMQSGLPMAAVAAAFFIWTSVYNLFVVSVFWSFMADIYSPEQAGRLFGPVAAGGSLGAIAGPAVTAMTVSYVGPANLLPVSAVLLLAAAACVHRLLHWRRKHAQSSATNLPPATDRETQSEAMGGGILEGVIRVARSRYLQGICVFIWLYTTLATFLYFEQAHIVAEAFDDSATRTTVFAVIDLVVNTLTVLLQLFVTARCIRHLGLPRTLALLPGLLLVGFLLLAALPILAVMASVQIIRRAANYAFTRPGREMLFTVLDRQDKYKSKNFIDTVVYRGGDALSGWSYAGLSALGFGSSVIALLAAPLAAVWLLVGLWLGRRQIEIRSKGG